MNPPIGDPSYRSGTQAIGSPPATGQSGSRYRPTGGEPPTVGDESLVRRMAAADERAFGDLYDRWCASVHALAARIVRDAEDAEDIVEEVFWQAWRQAARYESTRGSVGAWLLTIARTRALDRLRGRQRRREELLDASVVDERPGRGADVAANAEASDRRARVLAALEVLPAEQRQVLEMAYFDGMSQTEIAERTGEPLGTVKTRVRLAMQKLRNNLTTLREESGGS